MLTKKLKQLILWHGYEWIWRKSFPFQLSYYRVKKKGPFLSTTFGMLFRFEAFCPGRAGDPLKVLYANIVFEYELTEAEAGWKKDKEKYRTKVSCVIKRSSLFKRNEFKRRILLSDLSITNCNKFFSQSSYVELSRLLIIYLI